MLKSFKYQTRHVTTISSQGPYQYPTRLEAEPDEQGAARDTRR